MNKTEWSAPSARIKTLLKERGLTQQDLANMLTNPSGEIVTVQNVKQLLNKPSLRTDTLKRIADAMKIPMWQLFASPEDVKGDDFLAVIRTKGQTHTFTSDVDLFDFVDELRGIKKHANIRGREYYQQKSSDD